MVFVKETTGLLFSVIGNINEIRDGKLIIIENNQKSGCSRVTGVD